MVNKIALVNLEGCPHREVSEPTKLRISTACSESRTVDHLIIVAGPSGSGKTTFLRQLSASELPLEIRAELPVGAEKWPHFKVAKGWLDVVNEELKSKKLDGLVLHYDLTAKLRRRRFRLSRKLTGLLKLPKAITVVNITAPTERLISQLAQNKFGARPSQSVTRMLLILRASGVIHAVAKMLPNQLAARLRRLKPSSRLWLMPDTKLEKQFLKFGQYQQSGWLDDLHEQWRDSLRAAVDAGTTIKQVYLEPELNLQHGETFKWRQLPGRKE